MHFGNILGGETKAIEVIERKTNKIFVEKVFGETSMRVFYGSKVGAFFTEKLLANHIISNIYGSIKDASLSTKDIEKFVQLFDINLAESEKTLSEFTSFNDFFARKLKFGARPIAEGNNVLASPGDGRLLVFPYLTADSLLYVKWAPVKLLELFGNNSELAKRYEHGSCAVLRLCPVDYHRFHFPASGIASETKTIKGKLHSVSPYALERKIPVYCLNTRTTCELNTQEFGNILLMEIGALMVGSIKQTYQANNMVNKGDEKGYFKFGGSTVIMFFEKHKVKFDSDLIINSKNKYESYVKMGEKIAISDK